MTLSKQLRDSQSPLRRFFDAQLPDTGGALRRLRQGLTGATTMSPPVGEIVGRYPYTEIGHASSIRLGLLFAPVLPRSARPPKLHPITGAPWTSAAQLSNEALDLISASTAHVRVPGEEEEERLCRYCYALGLFDQLFRTGPRQDLRILQVDPEAACDELLALAPPAAMRDLGALAAAATEPLAALPRAPVSVGPSFTGSPTVGGADGDLIAGTCLIDFKTSVDARLEARTIHQLVAYVLLDYDDRYRLDEVGLYMARQARLLRIGLSDLLALMARTAVDVEELRSVLRKFLH